MTASQFTAVILAADRRPDDPLVAASNACCKALVEVNGIAMLQRVVASLQGSKCVDNIVLCGPAREQLAHNDFLESAVRDGQISWRAPQKSPSSSAYQAMQSLPRHTPVLVTTADHPLLSAEIVDYFLGNALQTGADVAVGVIRFSAIKEKFPRARKTVTRLRDGGYCGCNLFAFLTPQSHRVAAAWRRVEQQRKNPLRVISQLGWWSVLRYLLGRLTLDKALAELSERLKVDIRPVHMPFPEAAIDVDSIADQRLVEEITGTDR